jgi:hypothetical protein
MLNQIERACVAVAQTGAPITFVAIAEHTGIARSTLYRNQDIRTVIEHHRSSSPDQTITALTEELATLRATIHTLADKVRHHEAQLRRLTQT